LTDDIENLSPLCFLELHLPFAGLAIGLLTAVITKFTGGVRVLEPLALLGGAYLAYVTAELFHWYACYPLLPDAP
jgi:hypothetical protein